ncbi:MAG TPA: alpha-(1-_3)-arabinofuranosyltransferase family protein [Acidimicrobiia bacterium]
MSVTTNGVSAAPARAAERSWPGYALLALIAYVPFLLSAPGRIAADTKQYLYLDPGKLLADAPYLWDPGSGAGTVTHQNIGYLFPMGPYFWLLDRLGIPDWVAQRVLSGSIVFAAGAGVVFLLSTLGLRRRWCVLAAALVYMLTPYQLAYTGRISAILLPWAGLPWMLALTVRAVRRGGWYDPALFALVVLTVGGTNATSLLLVGLAPGLWLIYVLVAGEASGRAVVGAVARIGVLVVVTSLWWISGLVLQGRYGINYLDTTETVRTVTEGSSPVEVLRGLGNWFFYGGDAAGAWIPQAVDFTQRSWLLVLSFAIPALAFAAAAVTRWRHRAYFVALLVLGVVVSVGAFPYADPTPLGALFKSWATGSTVGLAMRSTPRAVPLVVLALAVLIGAGLEGLARRAPAGRTKIVAGSVAVLVAVLAVANLAPVWRDGYIAERNSREGVPSYWREAAAAVDRESTQRRVLEIPGAPTAAYRWGTTVDPITPGIIDRPWVSLGELTPLFGSPAAANLVSALDRRIQEGTFEPDSLAPIARLLSSGTVLLRSDLEYERFDAPRPRVLWAELTEPLAPGLGAPHDFGPARPNLPTRFPVVDEAELATPGSAPWPPEVALFDVTDVTPIVHTAPTRRPVLVAGDGEALVDAAAAGLIDGSELVVYSASFAGDRAGLRRVLHDGADLLVSDTNRRRARRWGAVRDVTGRTERAGEQPVREDTEDKRIEVFPGSDDRDRSVVEQRSPVPVTVTATGYGERSIYAPNQRPSNALDGDRSTAWRVGGGDDPTGERLIVDLAEPAAVDRITLRQPEEQPGDRFVTKVRVHLDDHATDVALGDASRHGDGQEVRVEPRRAHRVELEILDTNTGKLATYGGSNGVGFAEVRLAGPDGPLRMRVEDVVRMPTRLLAAAGRASLEHRLVLLMSRLGYDPASTRRQAEEPAMARAFSLPTPRTFSVRGQARVDPNAPDTTLDEVLGTVAFGAAYRSSGHLRGDAGARASRAFDDDRSSAWVGELGDPTGRWLEASLASPITVAGLDLVLVADGRHSVPTRLRLEVDGAPARTVDLPQVVDGTAPGSVVAVPVTFDPVTGSRFRVVIDSARTVTTRDARTGRDRVLPVAIASAGMAGAPAPAPPGVVPASCRDDLVSLDRVPLALRLVGTARDASGRRGVALESCASPVPLQDGRHLLEAAPGPRTGIDVDRLVLGSERGGGPLPAGMLGPRISRSGARARVTDEGPAHVDVKARTDGRPFWLVFGQSANAGWHLEVDGGARVGARTLVNGYANGWRIEPDRAGELSLRLRWTPQRLVWWGIALSIAGVLACVVLVLRRRGRGPDAPRLPDDEPTARSPFARVEGVPSVRTTLVAAGALGLVAGLGSRPWIGIVVALATAATLRIARMRGVLGAASVVVFGAAAAYVVVQQGRYGYPTISSWPSQFDAIADLTWLAVWLLGADVVVDWVHARWVPVPST